MFNKLLSNLPFNPSLLTQVSFYSRRLRQEASIRRLGFVFVVLAMVLQIFVVVAPPQASLAKSTNDIIYGGLGGDVKANLLAIYDQNTDGRNGNIQAVFSAFNISRADLANTSVGTINSGDHSLYSLGRDPHSTLDQPQDIAGTTYYLRPLYTWGDGITYQALIGSRSGVNGTADDQFFAVMVECGNIVIKVRPVPNLTAPNKVARTDGGLPAADTTVVPGQTIGYRVIFSNLGVGTAHNVTLVDPIPPNTTYAWHGSGAATNGGQLVGNQVIWQWAEMPGQRENWYIDLNVTVNNNVPNGTQICNVAFLNSLELPTQRSQQVCHTVNVPAKPITPAPTPTPTPQPIPQPGQPHISKSKTVSNLTAGVANANNTTAKPKDTIEYHLLTINSGNATAYKYNDLKENVNDILEYADIIEISDSGSLDKNTGLISWKAADIKPNTTLTRTFKIQVKDPIPATPRSASNPQSFDLRMDNVYGNLVSINLPAPTIAKQTEQLTTTTLPNTGPGTTLLIGAGLTTVVGYCLARNRLLTKEVELVRHEYTTSGGV